MIAVNLASLFLLTAIGKERRVIIETDQKVLGVYDLTSTQQRITAQGALGPMEILIHKGKVRVISSSCPNQNCCQTGWINHQGQIVCCVPNKILIRISGSEDDSSLQLDGIAR